MPLCVTSGHDTGGYITPHQHRLFFRRRVLWVREASGEGSVWGTVQNVPWGLITWLSSILSSVAPAERGRETAACSCPAFPEEAVLGRGGAPALENEGQCMKQARPPSRHCLVAWFLTSDAASCSILEVSGCVLRGDSRKGGGTSGCAV